MLQYSICAFLAPALVSAAAFPWAGPEPTLVVPEIDHWSPAPTDGPKLGQMELFRRADDDNTCGYISQDPSRSLTCNDEGYICATNTFYGVHGCCDPASISVCTLYTSCVGSVSFSAECTGDCLTDNRVAKCTSAGAPSCYEWHYVYASTVMTEHGCDSEAFTISAWRTPEGASAASSEANGGITDMSSSASSTASSTTSSTSSATTSTGSSEPTESPEPEKKSTNVGAIAGGAVGGVVVIAAIAFGLFFLFNRKRRNQDNAAAAATGANQPFMGPAPGVEEYKPQTTQYGSPQPYNATPAAGGFFNQEQHDNKQWAQPQFGVAPTSPTPQYSGPATPGGIPAGVAEAPGNPVQPPVHQPVPQRPLYEAP